MLALESIPAPGSSMPVPGSPRVERGCAAGRGLQGDLKTTQLGPIPAGASRQRHGSSPTPMGAQGAMPGRWPGPSPAPLHFVALVAQCRRASYGANLILLASERPKHLRDHPSKAQRAPGSWPFPPPHLSEAPGLRGLLSPVATAAERDSGARRTELKLLQCPNVCWNLSRLYGLV